MSLYQTFAAHTARLITSGVLRPGERLPSVRQACKAHTISQATVTQAYYLLESQGLIEARPKSGYFVRARLGHRPPRSAPPRGFTDLAVSDFIFQILTSVRDPSITPLGSIFPDPQLFPLGKLGRFLAAAARKLDPVAVITDLPPGNEELRRQLALRYLAQGANVSPQEIVITAGAMEGLSLCLQALTTPGDVIAIEAPTFYAGLQACERLGLKVIEIPSAPQEGVCLDALAQALQEHPIKACLLSLNFANPTGACVPDARKRALLSLMRTHQVPLIEDDVYGELYFGAEPPLASKALDTDGLVLHVSSFSKCLAPGYRVGWVAAGRFAQQVQRQKYSTSLASAVPLQMVFSDYLKYGGFDKHLRALRKRLETQKKELMAAVEKYFPPPWHMTNPDGGYFLWLELPGVDTLAVHREALARGISIAPGPIFSAQRAFSECLRLNFGYPLGPAQEAALQALGEIIQHQRLRPAPKRKKPSQ